MKKLPFKKSKEGTLGVELEYQIIDPKTYDLASRAKDLICSVSESKYRKLIKPEITQSMVELNTSIHASAKSLQLELKNMKSILIKQGNKLGIRICGGGTHPFQTWSSRKIYPTKRFENVSNRFRYLAKCSTVFGMHIHIGCLKGEDAVYLTHVLTRYVPQLIALSASSPFYQSVDTGFSTTRATVFNSLPTSGVMPFLLNWEEFSEYFYKMRNLGIVSSMKDFYWDIRPKPEFGTVKIRVCDTPLTIERAVIIAAYAQTIAYYLLQERPIEITNDLYNFYCYNKFQASRYGFEGNIINPCNLSEGLLSDDILVTIDEIKKYTRYLRNSAYIQEIHKIAINHNNDSAILKKLYSKYKLFPRVVEEQCNIWRK